VRISFFDDLDDVRLLRTLITDKSRNENDSFYFLNILDTLPVFDKERS